MIPAYPLCEQLQIDLDEIQARRAFLDFTNSDQKNLELIHAVIGEEVDHIIAEFYSHLFRFEELNHFLGNSQTRERLQKTQRHYLLSLGQQADQLPYFEERLRIGVAHERVGLEQKWYLGAYAILFDVLALRLSCHYSQDPARLVSMLCTLQKILTLDAILAVETYYLTTMHRLEDLLRQLTDAQRSLEELARIDGLTRINNRLFLMESLKKEFIRCERLHHPFTLLFLDIDHFKNINDRHGHAFGDFVLKSMVQTVSSVLRPMDLIGRFGGEEFLVGLIETEEPSAVKIAERIRLKVAQTAFESNGTCAHLTISIGLATLKPDVERIDTMIERADHALYRAKETGRNRVCVFEP